MNRAALGWTGIARLGLVQTSLGAIVVLTTSTLNRVMVVELALPAALPGLLVAIHYLIQVTRPTFGHGSDCGGRRTPWIIGGIGVLAVGGVLASVATAWMATAPGAGIALAVIAFLLVGAGVGASGTSLLVLLAARVAPRRRAAAATITWLMMIAGFAVTAGVAGALLDPFSMARLIAVTTGVSAVAFLVTVAAVRGIEGEGPATVHETPERTPFLPAVRQVMSEPQTRRFALFVFVSMLAYSAQDLVLEPFAGAVFGYTPGDSTQLGGLQHAGVMLGMLLVAFVGSYFRRALRACMIGGCLASAALLFTLAAGGYSGAGHPLGLNVFLLGVANGVFAVAAIGSMMHLVSEGHERRDGVRMGVWGAAQAIAFGLGGVCGTVAVDVTRIATGSVATAYGVVFIAEATLFVSAALLAARLSRRGESLPTRPIMGLQRQYKLGGG